MLGEYSCNRLSNQRRVRLTMSTPNLPNLFAFLSNTAINQDPVIYETI
jgi:hypothetical protein